MINRLIAPSSGTIRIDGVDTAGVPPEQLRRRIGYVIQGHGLFPHWSVARNIATVPRLLGWPAARIDARARTARAVSSRAVRVRGQAAARAVGRPAATRGRRARWPPSRRCC
jgi:ABC-type Fe3+/spermidine/putrescine transport system ATPase subunit